MAEGKDTAHDVLAAEAFAVPGPDPALRRPPVTLPEDPSGITDPHDVLAAEEFAMPVQDVRRVAGAPAAGRLAFLRRGRRR
jgi:hypothetical protein